MSDNENKADSKISAFLEKNFKVILGVAVVLLVFLGVAVAASAVAKSSAEKGIAKIEAVDYEFRKDAENLSDEEFAVRQDAALAELESLSSKGGIVGVRANMLKAEILFQKKDFENSRSAWVKAAETKKSVYTAPICFYNAAVCSENVNDLDSAVAYYSRCVGAKEFYLSDHAYFNLGRVYEAKGDYENAKKSYETLFDGHSSSPWAPVAKSRVISINSLLNK